MTLKSSFHQISTYSYTPPGAVGASTIVTYQSGRNPGRFYSTITSSLGAVVLTNRGHKSEPHAYQAGVKHANVHNLT